MGRDYTDDPLEINLGNDLFAWIDPIDIELCEFDWVAKKAGRDGLPHYYAARSVSVGGHKVEYYLHNEVWELANGKKLPPGFLVDHINGDKLDNRRSNLRLATRSQNEMNKLKRRTHKGRPATSKYKGVCLNTGKRKKKWRAFLTIDGKRVQLGAYYSEREAALAYNAKAKEVYGEFALLNEVENE